MRAARGVHGTVGDVREVGVEVGSSVAHHGFEGGAAGFLLAFEQERDVRGKAGGLAERADRTEMSEPLAFVVARAAGV